MLFISRVLLHPPPMATCLKWTLAPCHSRWWQPFSSAMRPWHVHQLMQPQFAEASVDLETNNFLTKTCSRKKMKFFQWYMSHLQSHSSSCSQQPFLAATLQLAVREVCGAPFPPPGVSSPRWDVPVAACRKCYDNQRGGACWCQLQVWRKHRETTWMTEGDLSTRCGWCIQLMPILSLELPVIITAIDTVLTIIIIIRHYDHKHFVN